ncbi:MAG TPA: hypothetical protein VGS62_08650 [Streptosporangiaceae bacterium]|nr:hypothetical protein [Streptosporangiaceae bacterium]
MLVSWPRSTYIFNHKLPASRDAASYVWGFWWVARQVRHLSNPWFTHYLAAPIGANLGFHALMPLEDLVMMPITMAFGPSASYNLLSLLMPGLLGYAMYRVGRLWLPSQAGAIAAGAFFGLSSMMIWRSWYHLNIAVGVLFIPLALEAAVRLRRRPTWGQAVILGLVLAASLLSDQEMFILVMIVTVAALVPYLISGSPLDRRDAPAPRGSPAEATAAPGDRRDVEALPGSPADARAVPGPLAGPGVPAQPGTAASMAALSSVTPEAAATTAAAERPEPAAAERREPAVATSLATRTGGTAAPAAARAATGGASRPARDTIELVVRRLWPLALAGLIFVVVASPQIAAMVHQTRTGGATSPPGTLAVDYAVSGIGFPEMFAASPRINDFGLHWLDVLMYRGPVHDGVQTFGLLVSVLAVLGLVACWRRRSARLLALFWLGLILLTLGANLKFGGRVYVPVAYVSHGVRLSAIMPYSWFVNIPFLQGFREAARISMLALVPAALLAGAAVNWLRYHAAPALVVVAALGIFEAGWSGNPDVGTMPTALPRLDAPIAADHSSSIVVDVPFGLRGGVPIRGEGAAFNPEAQNLATADGHPRAVGFLSRLPMNLLHTIQREPFYHGLLEAQMYPKTLSPLLAQRPPSPQILTDRRNASQMNIGWVIVWSRTPVILRYLRETGFVFAYRADGALVYRAAAGSASPGPGAIAAAPGQGSSQPAASRG